MFLLSCGAAELRTSLPLLVEEPVGPGRTLYLAADPASVHFRRDGRGFRLEASPLSPSPAPEGAIALTIDWDPAAGELRIRALPHAGSTVYHHLDAAGGFTCASRVALLRQAGVLLEESSEGLPDYFRYRYLTPPHTLFRGVEQLAKAELRVQVSAEGCRPASPERYRVFPEPDPDPDPEACVDETLAIFEASFESLRSRGAAVVVPLSGGMDSSVLFRLAQRAFGSRDAWSAGYPFEAESENREKRYAASAAAAFGVPHHYHSGTTAAYLEALIRSIAAAEEPLHHLQSPMIELLFRDGVAPERDLVVLGVGAGGVFGTPLQQLIHRNARHPGLWRALGSSPLATLAARASQRTGRGRRLARRLGLSAKLERSWPDPQHLVASVDAYGDPDWIAARFAAGPADLVRSRQELLQSEADLGVLEQIAIIDLFDKTQFLWAKILASAGRRSHFPFMQADLQRHVLATPWALRLASNKALLAGVARRLEVPEFILTRAKSGFGVQRSDWATRGGPLDALVPLAAKGADEAELRALQSTEPGRAQAFWCLLNLALWRRLCLEGESAEQLVEELREQQRVG